MHGFTCHSVSFIWFFRLCKLAMKVLLNGGSWKSCWKHDQSLVTRRTSAMWGHTGYRVQRTWMSSFTCFSTLATVSCSFCQGGGGAEESNTFRIFVYVYVQNYLFLLYIIKDNINSLKQVCCHLDTVKLTSFPGGGKNLQQARVSWVSWCPHLKGSPSAEEGCSSAFASSLEKL